jgi:ribosome biogenesis GTPase / thiamine phosphate phosphatase
LSKFDLGELGWTPELAETLQAHQIPARVAVQHRGAYDVLAEHGELRVRLPGRLLHDGVDVAVGDWVAVADDRVVQAVLPRRSAIVRNSAGRATGAQTLAANVDVAFVVSSLGPELEPRRIERYLVTIWESGAAAEIVLTKADRLDDPWPLVAEVESVAPGVPVHVVSAVTGRGCDALRVRIGPGETAVLLGSSGVGKSTLVNRFAGRELMAVKETRSDDDEGRHTTTHRELILLPGGGVVIDTPGLRELQLWDVGERAGEAFSDIDELAGICRFNDCAHSREPGCAVIAAVESGALAPERLQSWRKLQKELRAIAVRHDARLRREETRRWQQISREARARTRHR